EEVETPEEIEEAPEEPETPETPTEVVEEKKPSKLKVDYTEFLNSHREAIETYHRELNVDYSKLSAEELIEKQMKLKYPMLSDQDIKDEMKEKYGLGVDMDDLDSEDYIAV